MFFNRNYDIRTMLPIEIAHCMLWYAMAITYSYQNDKRHNLNENELTLIDMFVKELEKNYVIALNISGHLRQRMNGEVEGFD